VDEVPDVSTPCRRITVTAARLSASSGSWAPSRRCSPLTGAARMARAPIRPPPSPPGAAASWPVPHRLWDRTPAAGDRKRTGPGRGDQAPLRRLSALPHGQADHRGLRARVRLRKSSGCARVSAVQELLLGKSFGLVGAPSRAGPAVRRLRSPAWSAPRPFAVL